MNPIWSAVRYSLAAALVVLCCGTASAQNVTQIQNVYRPNQQINIEKGFVESSPTQPGWESAQWIIEPVNNTNVVRIKNVWKGTYLNVETGALMASAIKPGWQSALWVIEPAGSGNAVRIKNAWTNSYLHTEKGGLGIGTIQPGWQSALWTMPGYSATLATPQQTPVQSQPVQAQPQQAPVQSQPVQAQPQQAPVQPLPAGAEDKKFNGDLLETIKNSSRWSAKSNVENTKLSLDNENDKCTVGGIQGQRNCAYWLKERDCGTSCHIQGIALTQNGIIVINHSLNPADFQNRGVQTCGLMSWSQAGQQNQTEGENISWTTECLFENWHPSGMDSTGNIVVTTDNWDTRDDDFDTFRSPNRIRFFDFSSGNPVELDRLGMPGLNAVAISYRKADQKTWLVTANPANDEYKTINMYYSNCYPLRNEDACAFTLYAPLNAPAQGSLPSIYVSSTGMSLMEDGDGELVLLTMYSSGGRDKILATKLFGLPKQSAPSTSVPPSSIIPFAIPVEDLGLSQVEGIRLRPSCRFGCGLNVINGELYFLLAARDIGNIWSKSGQFEIGIYKVGK